MELYRKVRLACRDGMSERAAARHFGVSRQSVRKMLQFSVPPGYRRTAPVRRPKLDEFTALIEQWLEDDPANLPTCTSTCVSSSRPSTTGSGVSDESQALAWVPAVGLDSLTNEESVLRMARKWVTQRADGRCDASARPWPLERAKAPVTGARNGRVP